jgi:hypothetical protein
MYLRTCNACKYKKEIKNRDFNTMFLGPMLFSTFYVFQDVYI